MPIVTPPSRPPRIAAVGLASWDRFIQVERYPEVGSYAIVTNTASLPGGTTSNSAVTLARLGAKVSLAALIGDDTEGTALRDLLEGEGIETRWLRTVPGAVTDGATVIVSTDPPERTIYWHQGARLVRGDRLDIAAIFAHDVVLLDVDDIPLCRFLVDLPAHTLPATRLLGTLTYLADAEIPDAFEIALRYDVLVGNSRQLRAVTGQPTVDAAIATVQAAMPGANLRAGVVTLGANGAIAFTRTDRWHAPAHPVAAIDTTGAGDAFAGALTYALSLRWPWPDTLTFANTVAALSTRSLGAQTSLPTFDEVVSSHKAK